MYLAKLKHHYSVSNALIASGAAGLFLRWSLFKALPNPFDTPELRSVLAESPSPFLTTLLDSNFTLYSYLFFIVCLFFGLVLRLFDRQFHYDEGTKQFCVDHCNLDIPYRTDKYSIYDIKSVAINARHISYLGLCKRLEHRAILVFNNGSILPLTDWVPNKDLDIATQQAESASKILGLKYYIHNSDFPLDVSSDPKGNVSTAPDSFKTRQHKFYAFTAILLLLNFYTFARTNYLSTSLINRVSELWGVHKIRKLPIGNLKLGKWHNVRTEGTADKGSLHATTASPVWSATSLKWWKIDYNEAYKIDLKTEIVDTCKLLHPPFRPVLDGTYPERRRRVSMGDSHIRSYALYVRCNHTLVGALLTWYCLETSRLFVLICLQAKGEHNQMRRFMKRAANISPCCH